MGNHSAASLAPSPWISRFAPLASPGGPVLDLACGGGRHGRLFLARQHPVTLLDRDLSGLADLGSDPRATLIAADLEDGSPWPLPGRLFAAVVVTNYLWRPLFPALFGALAPGGLLLYETFMRGNARFGKPSNPDFLLAADELFERCKDAFDIRAFEQGEDDTPSPAMRQRICAVKR